MRFTRLLVLLVAGACAYFGSSGVAEAASCSAGSPTTCTGGQGGSVVITSSGSTSGTVHSSPNYPATLTVSGPPTGATVTSIAVRFNGYTSMINGGACSFCGASRDVGIILQSPDGRSFQVIGRVGASSTAQTNLTVLIQDGGTALPDTSTVWSTGGTFAPTNHDGTTRDGEASPVYTSGGPSSFSTAAPLGTSTMASVFTGATVNGTWNVFLADDAANKTAGLAANVAFTSFDLIIGYSAASTVTATSISNPAPTPTTPFTSGSGAPVTITGKVTPGSGTTGSMTFMDGGTAISCAAGSQAFSNGQATCIHTFATEGIHSLSAAYSGDATFIGSTSNTVDIYAMNHATSTGSNPITYCNAGAVSSTGLSNSSPSATTPYPSVIFIGDTINTDIPGSVATVSVQLLNFSSVGEAGLRMLLVAPDGTHGFDFWDGPGTSIGTGNYTLKDGSTQLSQNSGITPGTYGPTAINPIPSAFTPGPPSPAPQVPGTYNYAAPVGSQTFETSFIGATGHGAWSLFLHDANGPTETASAAGGWCLTVTLATGHSTTTTLTSSAAPNAPFQSSVSFTATVTSTFGTVTTGTVTFTENGNPLTGAPNGGVANVTNGTATISTTGLPEGDHIITATYHDSSNTFNDSLGNDTIRIDKATGTPTLSGSTWTYCNTGAITIPGIQTPGIDTGAASPNPSNIMVSNLYGTVSSVTLTLKQFKLGANMLNNLDSLLVGPNAGTPTAASAASFDFFSLTGNNQATSIPDFGPLDLTISDLATRASDTAVPSSPVGPASYRAGTSYTSSTFFAFPTTFQHAGPTGIFSFNASNAVYANTLPTGVWSMYFNMLTHDNGGNGATGGWCLNFIENKVSGNGTGSHSGPAPNNHMRQGGTGSVIFTLQNKGDANSKGSTGDPDQSTANALVVSGTLPTGLSFGTLPTGSPWNCSASLQQLTCTNLTSVAAGSDYTLLTIPVTVSTTAGSTITVSNFSFGGAGMNTGTFSSDTITVDPAPVLAISKTANGTFTQGATGRWDIVVSNTAAAAGATDGTTVTVQDTVPTGYTIQSIVNGSEWTCGTSLAATLMTCTTTTVLAGSSSYSTISLFANIPATSAISVSNTAGVWGGGDIHHGTSANPLNATSTVTVVQVPATVTPSGGNNQTAQINTAFTTLLSATVKDAAGVVINGATVTFGAPGSGASGKFANTTITTTTTTNASGVASATTFTANGTTGGYNVSASSGSVSGNFSLTNTAGNATKFLVSAVTPETAGVAFSVNVTAQDAGSNTATGYRGTVVFSSTDVQAGLPPSYTFVSADNGSHVFSVTLKTAGSNTVTATDNTASITGTSNSITVTPGTAAHFTFNTPGNATAGTAFNFTVTAVDGFGNTATGYSGTVHFTSTDGQATLPGNLTFTNGTATPSATLKTAGTQTIMATDTTTSSINGTSNNISVSAGSASSMTANAGTTPQTATINTAFTNALAVTVKDVGNNAVSGVNVTFTAPGSGASGTFSNSTATITVQTNSQGVAAAPFTANGNAGAGYTVTAAASGLTTVNFTLTNVGGAASSMTANAGTTPQSATISTAFTNALAVTVKDSGSNPVSGVNVTFTAPGSGASGTFSNSTATITVATNAQGIASAPITANTNAGGPYNVTAAASGLTTVNFSLTNNPGAATSMTANAGTTPQSTTINTAFTNALAVTVKDAGSNPVSGVNVTFTAPGSGASGLFSNSTATITVPTNTQGVAAAPFTANGNAGVGYTVTAAASGLTTVNFTLTNVGGAASSMTANAGTTPQSATISTAFTNALAVTVKDSGSNPVSGVNVTFTAPGSGASGTFSNSTATITVATNAQGIASAPITANSNAGGPYTVTAAASGLTTVNFSLTNNPGAATSMTANAGTTPQSTTINTAFTNALAVTVKDSGSNPISGVNVTFTAPGSGASGTFSNSTATITVPTNTQGVAAAPFTANGNAGVGYTVTAAASGLTTVNFTLTNVGGAASSMTANAGTTPQSATISTAFTNPLAVTVKDSGNNPVSGVNVTFTAPGSGASGTFSNSTATITLPTNALGIVSAPITANSNAGGPYTVTAAASGLTTVNFSLTNNTGAPSSITANAGTTPQSTAINTAFTNALAVTVKDAGSNPVSGVNVVFNAPGAGASGTFSNSNTTIIVATNAQGIASAPFTANGTVGGAYVATASASGLSAVNFLLTNVGGAASSMTANAGTTPQSATISTAFTNALAVTVKDSGNNPVSGVNVTFTAPGSGASGTFSNTTATITVATNAQGIASAPITANSNAGGPYTVTAAASGLTTVNFSLTNNTGAASSMTANAGTTPQSTLVNTAFTNALAVTVKDAGSNPVTGVNVTFTAPGSGASGTFSNTTATITVATNAQGIASAPFTANGTTGPYTVTAAASGLTTVNFSLTNTATGPQISLNPVNHVVNALSNVTFTAGATGTPTPTVQWQVSTNGGGSFVNIPNATSTTLTFQATGDLNGNEYQAVFTNPGGSATTTAATLTVAKLTPTITWANPANMTYGGSLGSAQLNATANVAGTFVYSPAAGTVLPVGNNQTLTVTFTPTDTVNYSVLQATVSINVTQASGTPANLIVTSVLTRDPSTQEVIATVTFANSGGTAAAAVQLTVATIVSTPTTTALPISLGTVAGNGQAQTVIRFPSTVGTSGTRTTLTLSGTFTGGTFNGTTRISLP